MYAFSASEVCTFEVTKLGEEVQPQYCTIISSATDSRGSWGRGFQFAMPHTTQVPVNIPKQSGERAGELVTGYSRPLSTPYLSTLIPNRANYAYAVMNSDGTVSEVIADGIPLEQAMVDTPVPVGEPQRPVMTWWMIPRRSHTSADPS